MTKTPEEALRVLLEGNERFVRGELDHPRRDPGRRAELAESQAPFAIVLGCADSRAAPEIVFDLGIGDLFTVRVAGNTVSSVAVTGSLEFAAVQLECPLLMVLGHSGCGAVQAAVAAVVTGTKAPGAVGAAIAHLEPAVRAVQGVEPDDRLVAAAARENVRRQVALLGRHRALKNLVDLERLAIVGAEYDVVTGEVALVG